jgi:hypothetical protein
MLNKEDIKIKHIIGTFRDDPEYPTIEDFRYLILNWFWNEGGRSFVHEYRGVSLADGPVFPDHALKEKLNGEEEATKSLLSTLLEQEIIRVHKQTKFTIYYEIIK